MSAPVTPSEDVGTEDESVAKPRSLVAIFEEIATNLTLKMKTGGLPVPRMAFGKKELTRLSSPPRIVCVPRRGRTDGPMNRGGSGVKKAWALWGRWVTTEWHVWDIDDTATEVLTNHLVASIHDQCAGLYKPLGEFWGDDEDDKLGNELVIPVEFYTQWSREFIPAVLATSKTITGAIVPPTS